MYVLLFMTLFPWIYQRILSILKIKSVILVKWKCSSIRVAQNFSSAFYCSMVQLYHIVEIDLTFDILLHYTGISAVYLISVLGKHYRHYINQHKAFWKHQCRRLCGQCHMRAEDEKEFFISPFDNSCAMYWKGVKFSQVAASRLRRQWRWKYASRTMALTNDTVDKR